MPKPKLHQQVIAALGPEIRMHSGLDDIPLKLQVIGLPDLAVYIYTLTSPPGGRPADEYKIQLIAPGQRRGQRGRLESAPGSFTVLAGWSPEEDVFVLWDAYAYTCFSYSRNVQVKGEAIWLAQANGISTLPRHLRGNEGVDTVVACRPDHLLEGLRSRLLLSARRMGVRDTEIDE